MHQGLIVLSDRSIKGTRATLYFPIEALEG
jgi:signal transduction histidine kinase